VSGPELRAEHAPSTSESKKTSPAKPAVVAQARPAQENAQPRLSGVDPQDRLPSSQSEEDLLDIPAFLRRQAN